MDETMEATIARIRGTGVTYGCPRCGHRDVGLEPVETRDDGTPLPHPHLQLVCPVCGYRQPGLLDPWPNYPPEVEAAHRRLDGPRRG